MPPEEKPKDPIETWVMTSVDNATSDFYSLMSGLGGNTREVDPYYVREIEINGQVRTIRGRLLLLIHSQKEREDMLDKLAQTQKKMGLRRVTDAELAAIAKIEKHAYTGPGGTTWYPTATELREKRAADPPPPSPPSFPPEPDEDEVSRFESEGGRPGR